MLEKDTRFVELPQYIKHKLINIHKLSQQSQLSVTPIKIPDFSKLYTQVINLQTVMLQKNINILSSNFQALSTINCKTDFNFIEEQLKEEIKELRSDIEKFKGVNENTDFCGILETTVKTLQKKYEMIRK